MSALGAPPTPLPLLATTKSSHVTAETHATRCPTVVQIPAVRLPLLPAFPRKSTASCSAVGVVAVAISAMDSCSPKCMDTLERDAKKPVTTLTSSASGAATDIDTDLIRYQAAGQEPTIDLEELGLDAASQAEQRQQQQQQQQQQEESIVVDYEDSDGDRVDLRDDAGACTLSACRPLTESVAAAEDWAGGHSARRRSRCSSSETSRSSRKHQVTSTGVQDVVKQPQVDCYEALRCSNVHKLCMCEVQLHRTLESCWLVSSGHVYDVTGLVFAHPGGVRSILRKAGGPDCARDMTFHTKAARKMMDKCFIGKLEQCGDDDDVDGASGDANCNVM
ncbi:unnamed protein product [Hyaloperonospora brassicae]|uniref:Cytochrome b5 heme-binding domain-containing protein n=1 Tax=Hyaloperonospora brassicae TaxID=162125 RepID=A0AAV0V128_HYABA|nr:unnamed protein product [Hyaloperonospora brassicae]